MAKSSIDSRIAWAIGFAGAAFGLLRGYWQHNRQNFNDQARVIEYRLDRHDEQHTDFKRALEKLREKIERHERRHQ